MRNLRFLAVLLAGAASLAACHEAETGVSSKPPLAGVRFINALSDTGGVDLRAIDQVSWSPTVNNLLFRAGTEYQPLQADKARHFRLFATDSNVAVTSNYLADTTLSFTAGHNYTVLITGFARAKAGIRLVLITDDVTVPAGQIAVRALNAATGAVSLFLTTASTDAMPATATASANPLTASSYSTRPVGAVFARYTTSGSTTVAASILGPVAPSAPIGSVLPAAGVDVGGSAFSVVYFPASVTGTRAPQTAAFLAPGAIWFVDKNPT